MGCVTVRALCLVMMVMVTMGDQERADTLLRRRLATRTRQRHDTQSVEVDAREENIGDRNAEREANIRQRAETGDREDRHSRVHQTRRSRGRLLSRLRHQETGEGAENNDVTQNNASQEIAPKQGRSQRPRSRGRNSDTLRSRTRGSVRDRIIIRIPKDSTEAILDDNQETVSKSMHNEEPEEGKITKQSPSSRNSLANLEKVLNETTTPSTTTAATSTTGLASTTITEQDSGEEASAGPPVEIREDSSNNSEEINNNNDAAKDQVNRSSLATGFSPRFRPEPSHKNKNDMNDDDGNKNSFTPRFKSSSKGFGNRQRGGARHRFQAEKVTEKQPEDISQTASNLFLSTFMGAQRTEAPPVVSSTLARVVTMVTISSNVIPEENRGSIRIKSKGSSNRGLGSSLHRFRANPLKSQDRESMEDEEDPSKVISSSSRPVSGNFVEKTKLSLLSRTLFKDEAEKKSQNLPEIFNPPSQEIQKPAGFKAHPQQPKEVSKRPLFVPKAPRPRLAGLPFGFKPAKQKLQEPRESFNISKFSRKGNSKFLPPRLKYFGAKEEEEKTTTPQTMTTMEEVKTVMTTEESQDTTFEVTPIQVTTSKMETTVTTRSTTTTTTPTPVSSTRETTLRARAKGRGSGALRRRKPVGQDTTTVTTRFAESEMTEVSEPVTNTDNEDVTTQDNVDDMTYDDAVTMGDVMMSTTQEDATTSTTTTTAPTTPTTTVTSLSTSKDVKKTQTPSRSRSRGRTRGRLGIGERRKSPKATDKSKDAVKKTDGRSSESVRTRGRVRGRGRPRKHQVSEQEESVKKSVNSVNEKTILKIKEKESEAQTEKRGQMPRLRGRNRGSHRFVAKTSVRVQNKGAEEEDRAAAPSFGGSRRRLGSFENNEDIKEEVSLEDKKIIPKEKETSGRNSSENEISSSLEEEKTATTEPVKSTTAENTSTYVGANGGFGRKFLMKKKSTMSEEQDEVEKQTSVRNRVSGRQRGRFIKHRTEEPGKLDSSKDSSKKVDGRRTSLRTNKIRPRHRGTESKETNEIVSQSDQGLLKKETTRTSLRSRSSRRQSQNSREKGAESKDEGKKIAHSVRGRGRKRGRLITDTTSTTTTTTTTKLSTTSISTSTTTSTTANISTFPSNPTTTSINNDAADETTEDNSSVMEETETDSANSGATEYHFFPAESDKSKEKYKQQQTAAVTETQVEADHENTFVTIEEEESDDLSQHLNSALNLATVTWTQDPYRVEEVSEGNQPFFDIDFSKNTQVISY